MRRSTHVLELCLCTLALATLTSRFANASTIANVSVEASSQLTGDSCSKNASGNDVSLTCQISGMSGAMPVTATANAQASASFGMVSAQAGTLQEFFVCCRVDATASATFEQEFVVPGTGGTGTLVGNYTAEGGGAGDGAGTIIQGNASQMFHNEPGPAAITSTFTFGVPFDLSISVLADSGVEGAAQASIKFLGFTDLNGEPLDVVEVTEAPEPSAALLLGLGLLTIFLLKRKRKPIRL